MKKLNEQLKKEKAQVHMSAAEREKMRAYLLEYMEHKPIRVTAADKPHAWLFALNARFAVPALAVLLIFSLGGGVALASERALPGDALYPVKVNVTEEVRAALALSSEADFEWNVARAERRLEEAERLAAEGRLTRERSAELGERFDAHTQSAFVDVEAVHAKDEDLSLALNLGMEASLLAHQELLDHFAIADGSGEAEGAARLSARVSENLSRVDSVRSVVVRADIPARASAPSASSATQAHPESASPSDDARAEISTMMHTAESASGTDAAHAEDLAVSEESALSLEGLERIRLIAEKRTEQLAALVDRTSMRDQTEDEAVAVRALALARERIANGDRQISSGAHRGALLMYRDALQIATRAFLFARIGGELNIDFSRAPHESRDARQERDAVDAERRALDEESGAPDAPVREDAPDERDDSTATDTPAGTTTDPLPIDVDASVEIEAEVEGNVERLF